MDAFRRIRIGTDCSGMEAPIQAMRNLKVNYRHAFSCDVNAFVRATIEANFPHDVMYHDVSTRNNIEAPVTDLYVAGFPCQPFSTAGLCEGFKDRRGRGEIFFHILEYIRAQKPTAFILENVAGLARIQRGEYLNTILKELQNLAVYNVSWNILNTKDNGIPHCRRRWYCVGIMKDIDDGSFSFPRPIPCPSIELFLDARNSAMALTGLPPPSQTTALKNVKAAILMLLRKGTDPLKKPFVVDCDSSPHRSKWGDGVSPCITCSRSYGHWVTNRGRRLKKVEMMRLQGMNPSEFIVAVPECQLGKQLGNTMSVNVLERLLVRVLPAARLAKRADLVDRWETGQAIEALLLTRDRGFKKTLIPDLRRKQKQKCCTSSTTNGHDLTSPPNKLPKKRNLALISS